MFSNDLPLCVYNYSLTYDTTLSDKHCQSEFKLKLVGGLRTLDRCKAKGLMKMWALHHILLLQVWWDIMVYELPLSFIETLEQTVSKYISVSGWG